MQLSPQRTFVIQLAADTQILGGHMVGRIEHVVSHHAAHFDSLDSLLAFIAKVGREVDETTPERETELRATNYMTDAAYSRGYSPMAAPFMSSDCKEVKMATLSTYVQVVQSEAKGLAQFLDALSTDEWQRSSACDLWTIRDVTAHLVWAADFYTDTVSRGRQGDISLPEDGPPGDAPDPASMPAYFDQQTMQVRDRLGSRLMPTFRSSYQVLSNLMMDLSPQEWDMPCSFFPHYGGKQPAKTFLYLIIQELVIHGWDIRSRFDEAATLAAESLSPLMERIPNRFLRMPGLAQFPIDADRWPLVRYRFDLEADCAFSYDMVVEGGKARMEPSENALADVSLHCDRAAFVLMMYKRLTLDSLGLTAHVTVEGDRTLVTVLDQWLKQP